MNKELVSTILYTLNSITVSGEENLDKLLACIRVMKEIERQLNASGKEEEHGENDSEL